MAVKWFRWERVRFRIEAKEARFDGVDVRIPFEAGWWLTPRWG